MIESELDLLSLQGNTLIIFRSLYENEVFSSLMKLISNYTDSCPNSNSKIIQSYCDFVSALYQQRTSNLSEFLLDLVLENENIYVLEKAKGNEPFSELDICLKNELQFLQRLSIIKPEYFLLDSIQTDFLPKWKTKEIDFYAIYQERIRNINQYGYGKWAKNAMFQYRDGKIQPIKHSDTQELSQLYGYEYERKAIVDNTLALIHNLPAQNALLYGDAGTGKSSTVKAVVNAFFDQGLRLIEITKNQLMDIPAIIDEICDNPLKFILFIDDLSFLSGEDCFGALKAVLEGSASAKSSNMIIYATSNRRHLVKETFSERDGDEIHRNDSMQETLSLSARFGLRVNFSRPDKKKYLDIVHKLAESHALSFTIEELDLKAEQFAISTGNGRSPRTAKQFISQLISDTKNI